MLRRLLAPLVGLLLALPSAAYAGEWSHGDPAGDVRGLVPGPHGEVGHVDLPDDAGADVTRIEVDHDTRRVRVRVELRDLRPERIKNLVVRLRTPTREFVAWGYQDRTDAGSVELGDRRSDYVPCEPYPAIDFRFDSDVVVLRIASACLGDPRWVRVGVRFGAFDRKSSGRDDALGAGGSVLEPRLGPKVRVSEPEAVERDPIPTDVSFGWVDTAGVGTRYGDAQLTLPVRGDDPIVITGVHAEFDRGVRSLGALIAPPRRPLGGFLLEGWPQQQWDDVELVSAVGARLTPTRAGRDWLLVLGYEVERRGVLHRPDVTVDYRVGRRHYSAVLDYSATICAGPRSRRACS